MAYKYIYLSSRWGQGPYLSCHPLHPQRAAQCLGQSEYPVNIYSTRGKVKPVFSTQSDSVSFRSASVGAQHVSLRPCLTESLNSAHPGQTSSASCSHQTFFLYSFSLSSAQSGSHQFGSDSFSKSCFPRVIISQFVLLLTANVSWTLYARLGARWGEYKGQQTHPDHIPYHFSSPSATVPGQALTAFQTLIQTATLTTYLSGYLCPGKSSHCPPCLRFAVTPFTLQTCLLSPDLEFFTGSSNVKCCSPESQNSCAMIGCEVCHKSFWY